MPIVKEQKSSGSGSGQWEDLYVQFDSIAEGAMKNGGIRLLYKGKGDKQYNVGVDPDEPMKDLIGFVAGDPPVGDVDALRRFVAQNVIREKLWVTAQDQWIQYRGCALPEGEDEKEYTGELSHIYTYDRAAYDNPNERQDRAVFILYTDDGERCRMDDPTPSLIAQVGKTGAEDVIDGELNRDKGFWYHAIACGLDWTQFIDDMKHAEALWPGHWTANGEPVESFFSDTSAAEWPKDIMRHIERYGGPLRVKWTMTKDDKGRIKPKRNRSKIEILETLTQQISATDKEWIEWRDKFVTVMDLFTGQVTGSNANLFVRDRSEWFLTEPHGVEVALHLVKPIIEKWPNVVANDPFEGITTRVAKPVNWPTDLMIAVHKVVDTMLREQKEQYDLAVAGLVGEGRHGDLIAWIEAHPAAKEYLDFGQRKL